jgi:lon-related putative ATP-dependent protease
MSDGKQREHGNPSEAPAALSGERLSRHCDPQQFSFHTTDELAERTEILGQKRAVDALRFGADISHEGYNIYAANTPGSDAYGIVRHFLEQRQHNHPTPPDWCYVNNFDNSYEPRVLELPAGRGATLKQDMARLIEDLQAAIPEAFDNDDYRARKQALDEEINERQRKSFEELQQKAEERSISVVRTPQGIAFAPMKDGQVLNQEQIQQLSDEERNAFQRAIEELQKEFQTSLNQVPAWRKEYRERLRELDQETTRVVVDHHIGELRDRYQDLPDVLEYLDTVGNDIIEHYQSFAQGSSNDGTWQGEQGQNPLIQQQQAQQRANVMRRYHVNVLVDNGNTNGAPIIYEDQPNYANLFGRIDHISQFGALVTDYTMLRAGSLHRANGGYLLVDARKLLTNPFCWEELKRSLRAKELRFSSPGQNMGLISTITLEPAPIALNIKVVLLGERLLHHLLSTFDPEFEWLFKVTADFDDDMQRDTNTESFAEFVATHAKRERLRPVDRDGVARVVDFAARLAEDAEKITTHTERIKDLLRESDHLAAAQGKEIISAEHVQQAIDGQRYRTGRIQDRIQEEINRGTILIDTDGTRTGQINGLSVAQLGRTRFGKPNRITARVRLGRGNVIDIEREANLGGPIHSKGVMIMSGFLGARYTQDAPFTLSASLVFEQSYGGIEGDSASLAETCALLSAIGEIPLRQNLALTGSINQHGQVQAIGGVNEKIEGFFDICAARGLTEGHGVIIPESNVKHLMLRDDVVRAAHEGRFAVYSVSTVDQAMELLTGTPAGSPDQSGRFPEESVNGRVARRLEAFAEKARAFQLSSDGREPSDSDSEDPSE